MDKKAYVLLSGGLDSTTALYIAHKEFQGKVEAVSFDYGQRHKKEMEYAKLSCDQLNIPHTILSLGSLLSGSGIMLTDPSVEVPNIAYSDIKGVSPTYVPFRNGMMLSAITALAQKYVMEQINIDLEKSILSFKEEQRDQMRMYMKSAVTDAARDLVSIYAGMHAEDAANHAYPDCTFEFLGSMANAINVGSYGAIRLVTPFVFSNKDDIVRIGNQLEVPYENSWSCYKGEELHCGTCPTCRSRKDAFAKAMISDPTEYADDGIDRYRGLKERAPHRVQTSFTRSEIDDEIPF